MVLLSNSGELAVRYSAYIEELQEFFATHELRYGTPRELGFFAARLSGRDSFPGELASMVRSFIFRERGSIPLDDLLCVVALAVGGSAVADSAPELQHPLRDLSEFLASVASAPRDQPQFDTFADEPDEPIVAGATDFETRPDALPHFAEPADLPNPFVPPDPHNSALAPAILAASDLQRNKPASAPPEPAGSRRLWVAGVAGLALPLLLVFLYHLFAPAAATPYPEAQLPSSSSAPTTISAPHTAPQTSLAAVSAALAHPTSPISPHLGTLSPLPAARPGIAAATNMNPRSPAMATPAGSSQPSATMASTPSSPIASGNPSPAPALAPTVPTAASSAKAPTQSPRPAPPRSTTAPIAVASVTAHQASYGVSSGIMSSHLLSSSQPQYPRLAGFTHAEGQVILQAVVSKTGKVATVKVLSGPHTLRKAAVKSVRQWRYRPYVADGRAVDVATIISIDFKAPH